jgi:hypothetical protein
LAIIAYYLTDYNEVRLGWVGSYLWAIAYLFGFVLYLLYLLQFVLPLPWYRSIKEGVLLIFDPTFPYVSRVTRMLVGRPLGMVTREEHVMALPASFRRYRAGILPSHQALALTRGPHYGRAVGPGYIRLQPGETITQIVDLRRQSRTMPVKAMSRDGIPIETSVSVRFQVKRQATPVNTTLPYPYDQEAIFGINYLSNYRSERGILLWGDRIIRSAASILVGELAQYALDELYQPDLASFSPRKRINGRMEQKLQAEFESQGVTIIDASSGRLTVPQEVVQQLISNWQTEWQRRINEVEVATENAANQRIRRAQARAEIEIVTALIDSIQALQSSGDGLLTDIVTARVVEAMQEAVADEQVKALVSSQALDTMNQLQDWMQDWDVVP